MTPAFSQAVSLARELCPSRQDDPHPRPTLVRTGVRALDREVGFAHDDDLVGLDAHWERDAAAFARTIRLPFPPESDASGIGDKGHHPCVWYRIVLDADDLAAAGHAEGRRLLLHFGAVDYHATVFVDGSRVGEHEGGQTAFSFDVTAALDPDADEHVVAVRAFEDPLDTRMPRGKQDWLPEPHVIWYHRTTGIWRTLWLESVPPLRIDRLVWQADLVAIEVTAVVELNRRPVEPVELELAIVHGDDVLGATTVRVDDQVTRVTIPLSGQANGVHYRHLVWEPGDPTLLDAGLVLRGPGGEDAVASYLGLRDVGVGADAMTLNFVPFRLRSVLEQGYWPTSHLAPPSPDALREEVELIQELGFNSARIHQKTEDPRFLYWADRLGLTLWCETAAAYTFDSLAVARLTSDWVDIVRQYEPHPSIIAWVPFNESWGVTHIARDPAQRAFVAGLTDLTRALDPTRPVISNDGWEHANSDLLTIHDYEWRRDVLSARYTAEGLAGLLATQGPAGPRLVVGDAAAAAGLPVLLTEFGGVEFVTAPSADRTWGYSSAVDPADFERRVRDILEPVQASPVLGGWCWTQLTDTLQEANGLCDAERTPKLPVGRLRAIVTGGAAS